MFGEEGKTTLEDLDDLVTLIRKGNGSMGFAMTQFKGLNEPQQMYVSLASNKIGLLNGCSIVYALNRIGQAWRKELLARHQYH